MAEDKKKIATATVKKTQSKKNKQPVKKRRARRGTRNKYEYWISKDGLILLEGWARDGLSDEQIAKNIGIARTTLYDWKNKYSDIKDILKKGKEVVDFEVENALLKRALGFKEKVAKPMKLRVDQFVEKIEYVEEEVYYPPDTTAQIFWLKNRKPKNWQNKDKVVIQDSSKKEADLHVQTIKALQNRKVRDFEIIEEESEEETT